MIYYSPCKTASLPSPLIAPLDDNERAVALIAEVSHQSVESVQQHLYEEEICPGTNVSRTFRNWGLIPHVWNDELDRFYHETDAFLYESLVWNRSRSKLQMRAWIGEYLSQEGASALEILCLGDGLGFDSVYLAQAGHRVTYFEVPGYSEAFARRIIEDSGSPVRILTDRGDISEAAYDVVLCLDVLEHLPDPPSFVASIAGYLRPGGRTIISAPFYLVSKHYLTHLKLNQQYSGSLDLFERQGLVLIDGQAGWNPIVLRKLDETAPLSSRWNIRLWFLRFMGLYIATVVVHRLWGDPFQWINALNRRPNPIHLVGLVGSSDCTNSPVTNN